MAFASFDRKSTSAPMADINMVPLNLSKQECDDIVAFMESLTGAPRVVHVPMLPR